MKTSIQSVSWILSVVVFWKRWRKEGPRFGELKDMQSGDEVERSEVNTEHGKYAEKRGVLSSSQLSGDKNVR